MSSHYRAIVWIDHHEAKIFQLASTDVDSTTIHSSHPRQHIHNKANARGNGHVPVDTLFLQQVLITGPAGAKKELASYIEREDPNLAKRIAAVQKVDHPSDGELVKLAQTFRGRRPHAFTTTFVRSLHHATYSSHPGRRQESSGQGVSGSK